MRRAGVAPAVALTPLVCVAKSLGAFKSGRTDLSERAEELLAGFGDAP